MAKPYKEPTVAELRDQIGRMGADYERVVHEKIRAQELLARAEVTIEALSRLVVEDREKFDLENQIPF